MPAEQKTQSQETVEPSPVEKRANALLVEDNSGDARLIEIMLADAGADVFAVERVERLSQAEERIAMGDIAVVLLDLSLPDSHGLDTFHQLHQKAPRTPIIVLSGLNDTRVALQAVHDGAQDYLIKGEVEGQLLVRAMRYAIERKRMTDQLERYAEELRSKNAQLEADFSMAREIQRVFLPNHYPVFPRHVSPEESLLKFHHRYLPAAAVGGDFFDVFAITGTTAGIFICDVMGHGMRAALITAIMRGMLEELRPVAADPGKFLTEINRSLHAILRRTRETFMATAFYMVADCEGEEVRFSSAGHPSPFRVRRERGVVELLKDHDPRHGPALGLFERPAYPTCRCPAGDQDLYLLFTDGLFEAANADQEEFGMQRLMGAVSAGTRLPAGELMDRLLERVRAFSRTADFDDDVCLVGMEFDRRGSS
jgi:sigma-B regulation protein RsbU (phosphoserine phosphatase)